MAFIEKFEVMRERVANLSDEELDEAYEKVRYDRNMLDNIDRWSREDYLRNDLLFQEQLALSARIEKRNENDELGM